MLFVVLITLISEEKSVAIPFEDNTYNEKRFCVIFITSKAKNIKICVFPITWDFKLG